jgi:hypothetical protein
MPNKKILRKRYLRPDMRGCMPGPDAAFVDELIEDDNGVQTWILRVYDPDRDGPQKSEDQHGEGV